MYEARGLIIYLNTDQSLKTIAYLYPNFASWGGKGMCADLGRKIVGILEFPGVKDEPLGKVD